MKIDFFWEDLSGVLSPCCQSPFVNEDDVDLLACVLTDDGGCGYMNSISWITEAINKISEIKQQEISSYDWDRESWGVRLSVPNAIVYSLYDENYNLVISLDNFESILLAWRKFISEDPESGVIKSLNIN